MQRAAACRIGWKSRQKQIAAGGCKHFFDLLGRNMEATSRMNICGETRQPPEQLQQRLSEEMLAINMESKNNLPSYER